MKKTLAIIIAVIVAISAILSLTACGGGSSSENSSGSSEEKSENKTVDLNDKNILDYVKFDGSFTNGTHKTGIVNSAEATLEFQAYPSAVGKFNNVKITLIAKSNDHAFTYMNDMGNYWHLSDDSEAKNIKFSFDLGIDGKFSKNYSVECLNNTGNLSGSAEFDIVEVSGSFIPE